MSSFSAAEITEAYAALHARVQGYVDTGDWSDFALNFTEDATYVEHAFGTFRGREAIREWSVSTMTSFPGSVMTGFPLAWQVVDASATPPLFQRVHSPDLAPARYSPLQRRVPLDQKPNQVPSARPPT